MNGLNFGDHQNKLNHLSEGVNWNYKDYLKLIVVCLFAFAITAIIVAVLV